MEGPDGYVRTIPDAKPGPDDNNLSDADSDTSELQLDADDTTFFADGSVAAPSWAAGVGDADGAEGNAAPTAHDFQTTIDAKIRSARHKFTVAPPEDADENDADDKANRERDEKRNEDIDGSDEDDEDDDDLNTANLKMKNKEKQKKRRRKENETENITQKEQQTSFADLHLSKALLKAIQLLQWTTPTEIQRRAIPYILAGRDVCGSAVTGSGKTAAFLLPVIERLLKAGIDNVTRVIILLPTRELAAQCHTVCTALCRYTNIRSALVVGGLNTDNQQVALRKNPHIVIATPGRLIDHIRNSYGFTVDNVEVLIFDEGDRLLDLGFESEIKEILTYLPNSNNNNNNNSSDKKSDLGENKRQTLLFSATLTSNKLKHLIDLSLKNPVSLSTNEFSNVSANLQQEFVKIKSNFEDAKESMLLSLLTRTYIKRTIVFFSQKVVAHRVKILLGLANLSCCELHGNLTQAQRLYALDQFRCERANFLLCTDLAARGLDIAGVETVVNYDMPRDLREYIHRVGRTARAGKSGTAVNLTCVDRADERKLIKAITKHITTTSGKSTGKKLMARVIPLAVVSKWKVWIDKTTPAVNHILKEERQEREMRLAEMEVQKARNLIKFSDKIYSKPAKTWFQSETDKLEDKTKVRRKLGLPDVDPNDKSRAATKKRKADQAEHRKEEAQKRRKQQKIVARQEDYARQRIDARKQKKNSSGGKGGSKGGKGGGKAGKPK